MSNINQLPQNTIVLKINNSHNSPTKNDYINDTRNIGIRGQGNVNKFLYMCKYLI